MDDFYQNAIFSNAQTTSKGLSLEDLLDAVRLMPRGPSSEQVAWAVENGFVDWSGIKVSPMLMQYMRKNTRASVLPESPFGGMFTGMPIVVDRELSGYSYLTAKEAWALKDKSVSLSSLATRIDAPI